MTAQSDLSKGIEEIEQLAQSQELEVLQSGVLTNGSSIFEESEIIELSTRRRLRSKSVKALGNKLERPLSKALKELFFEVIFPTPR